MGMKVGARCAIWEIEDKGGYAVASLSTSKKNKDGKYETDWKNKFCWLVENAYENCKDVVIPEKGHIDIRIGNGYKKQGMNGNEYDQAPFEVTNKYDASAKREFTNYKIYDAELIETNASNAEDDTPAKVESVPQENTSDNALAGTVGLDFLNVSDGINATLPFK